MVMEHHICQSWKSQQISFLQASGNLAYAKHIMYLNCLFSYSAK